MKILDVLFVEEENTFVVKLEDYDEEDYIVVGPEFQFLNTSFQGISEPARIGC